VSDASGADLPAGACEHFAATTGPVPPVLHTLHDFDPEFFDHYWRLRRLAYSGGRDEPALNPATRELLFVLIAAVLNNPGGARVHLRAGRAHGMSLDQVREMLLVVLFERGAHGWVDGAAAVWQAALDELGP
jgi:alkylhydroperoxidase/carboxymuconolactone decarboxylase family protein YurZ